MIFPDISALTATAALLYALSSAACLRAAYTPKNQRQLNWQKCVWIALAVLFALLLVSRVFGLEEALREAIRSALRAGGNYGGRREFQSWIAGFFLVLAICGAAYGLNTLRRKVRGKRAVTTYAALLAGVLMVLLAAIRLISLHVLDGLLYGPLKLNWVFDIGLTVTIISFAVYHTVLVRKRFAEQARPII